MAHLPNVEKLDKLSILGTNFTDDAIPLTALTRLRAFRLGTSEISDAGTVELLSRLPKCDIIDSRHAPEPIDELQSRAGLNARQQSAGTLRRRYWPS